jgi:ankyrin repeat protein
VTFLLTRCLLPLKLSEFGQFFEMSLLLTLFLLISCANLINAYNVFDFVKACNADDLKTVKKIHEAEPDLLNKRSDKIGGQTCLMSAVLGGGSKVVKWCLLNGADHTIGENQGYTPMHGAGFQGRYDIAQMLIDHGLNPSDRHEDGFTPIHRACWGSTQNHAKTFEIFVLNGVSPDESTEDGSQPCLKFKNQMNSAPLRENHALGESL